MATKRHKKTQKEVLAIFVHFCAFLWQFVPFAAAQEVPEEFGNPWMANLVELEAPSPVPWWPPAPGWYVLAALVGLALLYLVWRILRRWQMNAYRREGVRLIREAAREGDASAVDTIAVVVKRVAIQTFGRKRVASLIGPSWIAFLDRTGRTSEFSNEAGVWLTDRRYGLESESVTSSEIRRLAATSTRWIRNHRFFSEADR